MEKIIFFGLVIPILGFVLYLGATAIMKGFKAKADNKPYENEDENKETPTDISDNSDNKDKLTSELNKLSELKKSGVLTQEEFEKAKRKILDN